MIGRVDLVPCGVGVGVGGRDGDRGIAVRGGRGDGERVGICFEAYPVVEAPGQEPELVAATSRASCVDFQIAVTRERDRGQRRAAGLNGDLVVGQRAAQSLRYSRRICPRTPFM